MKKILSLVLILITIQAIVEAQVTLPMKLRISCTQNVQLVIVLVRLALFIDQLHGSKIVWRDHQMGYRQSLHAALEGRPCIQALPGRKLPD